MMKSFASVVVAVAVEQQEEEETRRRTKSNNIHSKNVNDCTRISLQPRQGRRQHKHKWRQRQLSAVAVLTALSLLLLQQQQQQVVVVLAKSNHHSPKYPASNTATSARTTPTVASSETLAAYTVPPSSAFPSSSSSSKKQQQEGEECDVDDNDAEQQDLNPNDNRQEAENSTSSPATTTTTGTTQKKAKKKKKKSSSSSSTSKRSSRKRNSSSGGARRLHNEWKDVIAAGMGYDWKSGNPILETPPKTMKEDNDEDQEEGNESESESESANDEGIDQQKQQQPQQQHLWLGPLDPKRSLYVWHFSFAGVPGSAYEGGIYHGRVVFPRTYPLDPPQSIEVWTPSGRFQTRTSICLETASHYHPERWKPHAWTCRTLCEALRLHMVTAPQEIGGMNADRETRRHMALLSTVFRSTVSHKTKKKSSSVISYEIDHAQMIQQGCFPAAAAAAATGQWKDVGDDNDVEEWIQEHDEEDEDEEMQSLARRRHRPLPLLLLHEVLGIVTNPWKLAAVGFLVLFWLLNRGG